MLVYFFQIVCINIAPQTKQKEQNKTKNTGFFILFYFLFLFTNLYEIANSFNPRIIL